MLFGVARTTALAAGVMPGLDPAVVAVMSWLMLGERIAPRVAAGIACAVGGIVLVSFSRHEAPGAAPAAASAQAWIGNALLFGAVCCEALYVVIGKLLTGHLSARRISALVNLWGLALVTPLGLAQAFGFAFAAVTPPTWALLLFYALAASMFTVWLWMTGLRHVPASSAGCSPCSAAERGRVGVLLLGESLRPAEAGAYALALAGVVLAARGTTPRLSHRPRPHAAARLTPLLRPAPKRVRRCQGREGRSSRRSVASARPSARLRLQAVVGPHAPPGARARRAVPQPEHVARRVAPRQPSSRLQRAM
jgi:drug/metabolite transporter (DMT)-like permease